MGQLIRLAGFSKSRRSPQAGAAQDEPRPGYFCTRCNAGTFLLAACGQIHCAHCGALMRNIEVCEPA